ncbi:MAG: cation:proton antiporter [Muribaculaceae bacterium]|nr:cation:proton antiporter [Muribaculaceae bacterium]
MLPLTILLNAAAGAPVEMDINGLISDLAFILLLGAVVTLLFKWIKQPVVLGYIVAGFLASPNFKALPSVTTEANIEFWAQIGIVVLLFSLGVEFSFKKLMNVGGSAISTVMIIITGMMLSGVIVGHCLGMSFINCLFLGGMLSMSSTTIIIKAFTDMGLRQKRFAGIVFGVLIVEDLFAVLLMVILSSIALNNSVEGGELIMSVSKLVFFLVIWFVVGVYVLPSALNRVNRFLNPETLLVVSMGLCLGMAVFSVQCGFSLALGAFVMGSILAGTSYAERIEKVTAPVKDLFGAVFFISVGMMVQPTVIVEYWGSILLLSGVVIVGMIVFGSLGLLLTGQTLKVAIEAGFSLTQIGEFAFIIASLGMSLGVLDATIYPIVVAVSVITTFTTPYFIKMANPFYRFVEKILPNRLHFLIERYSADAKEGAASARHVWTNLLRRYLWRFMLYSIILIAIIAVSIAYFVPWLTDLFGGWGKFVGVILTLLLMAPFLLALSSPVSKRVEVKMLESYHSQYRVPMVVMTVFRAVVALILVIYYIGSCYGYLVGVFAAIAMMVLLFAVFRKQARRSLQTIESKFMSNLNERELRRTGKNYNLVSDLHQAVVHVGSGSPYLGMRLMDTDLHSKYGVNILNIQRGGEFIPVPAGDTRIFPGDVVGVVGTDSQIESILPLLECDRTDTPVDMSASSDFDVAALKLTETSPIIGHTVAQIDVRRKYMSFILAIQRGDEYITDVVSIPFCAGDVVWVAGNKKYYNKLVKS